MKDKFIKTGLKVCALSGEHEGMCGVITKVETVEDCPITVDFQCLNDDGTARIEYFNANELLLIDGSDFSIDEFIDYLSDVYKNLKESDEADYDEEIVNRAIADFIKSFEPERKLQGKYVMYTEKMNDGKMEFSEFYKIEDVSTILGIDLSISGSHGEIIHEIHQSGSEETRYHLNSPYYRGLLPIREETIKFITDDEWKTHMASIFNHILKPNK